MPYCGPGTLATTVSGVARRRAAGDIAWLFCVGPLTFDFPVSDGPDEFTVTKAIAAATDIRVTALVTRRIGVKRLRGNQRGFFIFVPSRYQLIVF
jgi:hypothetical protein